MFTSPVHPLKWYPANVDDDDSIDQILRRITVIYHHVSKTDIRSTRRGNETDDQWIALLRS